MWFTDLTGHESTYTSSEIDNRFYLVTAEHGGTLQLSGTFEYASAYTFPASAALMVYVESEGEDAFTIGQGSLDLSTFEFTITVDDVPTGSVKVYFSFSVLDPDQAPQYFGSGAVFYANVAHAGCTSPLTITLEWDFDDVFSSYTADDDSSYGKFKLYVKEPDGNIVLPLRTGVRVDIFWSQRRSAVDEWQ